jgi:hypothetical protein
VPPSRASSDDLRAVSDGLGDLVGEIRRLADKHTDVSADLKGVSTRLDTVVAAVARLEAQQQSGHFTRILITLEKAPWQVGALLASILLALVLIAGHVDLVALVAAYSHPKASP